MARNLSIDKLFVPVIIVVCLINYGMAAPNPQQKEPERSQSMVQALNSGLAMAQAFLQVISQLFNQFNTMMPKFINLFTNPGIPQLPDMPSLPDLPAKLHSIENDITTKLHSLTDFYTSINATPTDQTKTTPFATATEHSVLSMPDFASWIPRGMNIFPRAQSPLSKDVELISNDVIKPN